MRRYRRQAPGEQKRDVDALDNVTEIKNLVEIHLKHRQLKADLELMKLENKLYQQIRWLQNRRLEQLNAI